MYQTLLQRSNPHHSTFTSAAVDDIFFSFVELLSEGGKLTTHDGKTVTDLFPEFRPGQVLRFSRLFGPAKASSMPQQWRNAKKRKKKKKKQEDEKPVIEPPKSPPSPRPEDCMSDDEVMHNFGVLFCFGQALQKSRFQALPLPLYCVNGKI